MAHAGHRVGFIAGSSYQGGLGQGKATFVFSDGETYERAAFEELVRRSDATPIVRNAKIRTLSRRRSRRRRHWPTSRGGAGSGETRDGVYTPEMRWPSVVEKIPNGLAPFAEFW